MTASSAVITPTIRHQIYLQRYNSGVVRRMLALIARTNAGILERLAAVDPSRAAALAALLVNLEQLENQLRRDLAAFLQGEAAALAAYEAAWAGQLYTAALGITFNLPSQELVRAAALSRPFQSVHLRWATLGEHADEFSRRRWQLVRDLIRQAAVRGDSIGEIIAQLRQLLNISDRTAETIARTSMNHISNAAKQETYLRMAHLIRGIRWVAVLDHRTSLVCAGRDGKVYPVDGGPRPPAHPNCRSTTVPLFIDEPDPVMPTFEEWLRDQPEDVVRDILGKTRADLFLNGGLRLDRFTDNNGRPYTLSQLRARDADAFRAAGLQ